MRHELLAVLPRRQLLMDSNDAEARRYKGTLQYRGRSLYRLHREFRQVWPCYYASVEMLTRMLGLILVPAVCYCSNEHRVEGARGQGEPTARTARIPGSVARNGLPAARSAPRSANPPANPSPCRSASRPAHSRATCSTAVAGAAVNRKDRLKWIEMFFCVMAMPQLGVSLL